jgi:hypothetical protein
MHGTQIAAVSSSVVNLGKIAAYRGIRVLAWDRDVLYACRGYQVVRLKVGQQVAQSAAWKPVACFRPAWWRKLTSRTRLGYRLVRDGFHALTILSGQREAQQETGVTADDATLIGAIPGAIVTRTPGSEEFKLSHQVRRGTRPLHIAAVPGGNLYWGEYFDNRERAEVHIYGSSDRGQTWQIAYTFPAGAIRHVHNIIYDRWGDCLWILTGDEGSECKVLRASCDLRSVEIVLSGNQQARAVAVIPMEDALYLSTDTPLENNHVMRLARSRVDRAGHVEQAGELASSSIFGCRVGRALFFSTMVEPSSVNRSREVQIVGSREGTDWQVLARWQKDKLSPRYFQYGNAILPDGENTTQYLAATTIAVEQDDLVTTLWEVSCT